MDRRIVERVEGWDSRPVQGGYAGLRTLADEGFSGAVNAAGAWLFMLNGRVLGVFDGTIQAFDGASGTGYVAPDPALPLLFAMQLRDGESYATYYTNDTPLREVDRTLSDASFTGYVELSENVLSGDYYVVYYGGRSMSAAFVGSSHRLITGDEAFRKAADEVGIYEVVKVDLDIVDIPGPATGSSPGAEAEPTPDAGPAGGGPAAGSAGLGSAGGVVSEEESPPPRADAPSGPDDGNAGDPIDLSGALGGEPAEDPSGPTDAIEEAEPTGPAGPTEGAEGSHPAPSDSQPPGDVEPGPVDRESSAQGAEGDAPGTASGPSPEPGGPDAVDRPQGRTEPDAAPGGEEPAEAGNDPFSEEQQWRESRTIPALNPDESRTEDDAAEGSGPTTSPGGNGDVGSPPGAASGPHAAGDAGTATGPQPGAGEPQGGAGDGSAGAPAPDAPASEPGSDPSAEIAAERDALKEEREELARRVERLESELSGAGSSGRSGGPQGTSMSAEDALKQTDLFIRYGSKGKATLGSAHDGGATKEEVNGNLSLEHHTRFEEGDVRIEGKPFPEFLEGTIEYRFVQWVVGELLYEIRETRNRGPLRNLYDVLPRIDRVEFRGSISRRDEEGAERVRTFDVIVRDRMGQPLIVADINARRDPATGEMMEELIEAASEVGEAHDTLGAAFLVTASFFKPEALETAADATGSGLLSREKRRSFVKLSRKRGYHLCLVESRGSAFHVTVPEL